MANLSALDNQFKSLEKFCDGTLGVSARHLPSNREINFNAQQYFLMCSTYKVPIAIYLLLKVQRGELFLNEMCVVSEFDLRPGVTGTLNQLNYDVSQQFSVHNLLRLMMQESCNTATDLVLRYIGGPTVVIDYLQELGLSAIGFSHWLFEDFAAWEGIKNLSPLITLDQYALIENSVPVAEVMVARKKIIDEVESTKSGTATPAAMTTLLTRFFNNELLDPEYTDLLLKIMRRCQRGGARLMGMLPPRTPVAHKTGTLTGYTSDVGIITLPHDCGSVAISAYIKNSSKDLMNNERVLAEVGRTVYDFFLLSD
jgi:beta-lactamase class A